MLAEETLEKLRDMRMHTFARELERQLQTEGFDTLSIEERVGLMTDAEWTDRQARSLTRRLQRAKLRYATACLEDLKYSQGRGLDRAVIKRLSTCRWVAKHQSIMISGATGAGKTYLGCALAHQACRESHTAIYRRVPRLLHELTVARADGSFELLLRRFGRADVLVLDDWGLAPLDDQGRRDLLEITEDRYDKRSTIIASQLPFKAWYDSVGDPTLAEAILDRVVHSAHKITLRGESIRKTEGRKRKQEEN